jgi:bifunctional ADP-heptose synthase (sugar kinase/adenylyltransferase)
MPPSAPAERRRLHDGAIPARLAGRTVLIVGDVMLDHFVDRPRRSHFAGSARAGRRLRARGVPPGRRRQRRAQCRGARRDAWKSSGIVGKDAAAETLRADLARASDRFSGVVTIRTLHHAQAARRHHAQSAGRARSTTKTMRKPRRRRSALIAQIEQLAAAADAILVSDYLKGSSRAASPARRSLPRAARHPAPGRSKVPHIDYYAGATVITPNHHEAEAVTHMRIRTAAEALAAAFPSSAPAATASSSPAANTA